MAGSQLFQLTGSMAGADGLKVTMEEVSRWKVRLPDPILQLKLT